MKFLSFLLIQGLLTTLYAINLESNTKLNSFSMIVETNYEPTAKAFVGVQYIQSEYKTFKEQVAKNTTIEYEKCIEYIKTQKCNNIDQWQSVIEELKLENSNSVDIEVPFLEKQKTKKIQQLQILLGQSEEYDNRLAQIATELQEHKNGLAESSRQISVMYKLPEDQESNSFVQQNQSQSTSDALNADVPDIAHSELAKAKTQYDIADQSIQARAAQNVLNTASEKMVETLGHLQKAFEQKISDLREEKKTIKEDILRLRALIANENGIQAKNTQKIVEMEGLVEGCKGKPTNIEKDCEPIRLRAAKLYTEIDIVNSRTAVLYQELESFMKENINEEQVLKENGEQKRLADQQAAERQEELSYLMEDSKTGNPGYVPNEPKEQQPIHHLPQIYGEKIHNEQIEKKNQTETEQKA